MNKHKKIILLSILFFKVLISFSQIVDGPANFRDKPNGKVLFQLQNAVQISLKDSLNGWYKCVFSGYVEIPQKITDISLVPKGTKLFSKDLQLAGEVLYPIKYQYKGQIYRQKYALIEIIAYTFTKNIILKANNSNTDKLIWNDSNISDFKYFFGNEEFGDYSICNTTNYHELYLNLTNAWDRCLIKEIKTQKRYNNSDVIDSKIKLEFYPLYFKGDFKTKKNCEVEANNVYFFNDFFVSETLGCCDESNSYTAYSFQTLKPILSSLKNLFYYNDINNHTYLIGFNYIDDKNLTNIGNWYLADLKDIIDTLTVFTAKNTTVIDAPLNFILPDKFYVANEESNNSLYIFLEIFNIRGSGKINELYFFMQYFEENDVVKKAKISIENNRFVRKHNNNNFILGQD